MEKGRREGRKKEARKDIHIRGEELNVRLKKDDLLGIWLNEPVGKRCKFLKTLLCGRHETLVPPSYHTCRPPIKSR
jgi:hypothetical protein